LSGDALTRQPAKTKIPRSLSPEEVLQAMKRKALFAAVILWAVLALALCAAVQAMPYVPQTPSMNA
jgi:hypothetical protein